MGQRCRHNTRVQSGAQSNHVCWPVCALLVVARVHRQVEWLLVAHGGNLLCRSWAVVRCSGAVRHSRGVRQQWPFTLPSLPSGRNIKAPNAHVHTHSAPRQARGYDSDFLSTPNMLSFRPAERDFVFSFLLEGGGPASGASLFPPTAATVLRPLPCKPPAKPPHANAEHSEQRHAAGCAYPFVWGGKLLQCGQGGQRFFYLVVGRGTTLAASPSPWSSPR